MIVDTGTCVAIFVVEIVNLLSSVSTVIQKLFQTIVLEILMQVSKLDIQF